MVLLFSSGQYTFQMLKKLHFPLFVKFNLFLCIPDKIERKWNDMNSHSRPQLPWI